jgi:hypothetical protein
MRLNSNADIANLVNVQGDPMVNRCGLSPGGSKAYLAKSNDNDLSVMTSVNVTSITPSGGTALGGTLITLSGEYLNLATGASVGGAPCTSFTVINSTTASCITPAGSVGKATVSVSTPDGAFSANTLFTYTSGSLINQASLTASAAPSGINVNGTSTLSTTGGSGTGAVSYTLVSGPCTLSGTTLTATGVGSCVVTTTKAADSTYDSATSSPVTVFVALAAPSSQMSPIPTLSEWAMILMASLMGILAFIRLRRT